MKRLTRLDLPVGTYVRLEGGPTSNTRQNFIEGVVVQVFDALFKDGSEGNLDIDIQSSSGQWIRYKPAKDAGILFIKKGNNYERVES